MSTSDPNALSQRLRFLRSLFFLAPERARAGDSSLRRSWVVRKVLEVLQHIPHGCLKLVLPDGQTLTCGQIESDEQALLTIHDERTLSHTLSSGDIGFAEAYLNGWWSTDDLAALLRLLVRNHRAMEHLVYGQGWMRVLYRMRHWLRRNSRHGSRRNIHAHYDLGNHFYGQWLDSSWNYSSAWWGDNHQASLHDAQRAKVRRALREAGVEQGSKVLEIGCGWGALAEVAATEFNADVIGVTLSSEQLKFAQQRMQEKACAQQVDLRLQDYRELPQEFAQKPVDAVVSIEMFEAVGHRYWQDYFNTVANCLKPRGKACIQSIVIDEALFDRYLQETDFIQQYVFPGGCLPSRQAFVAHAQAAGLRVVHSLAFGADYARTLRLWRSAFDQAWSSIATQGFDERFRRLWRFYLCYCEAAFDAGHTDVVQFTLEKT